MVDNAHGAYLHFLKKSMHPITLGADICCDSAHKTLPVLTPGAYLHISDDAPKCFSEQARGALALFASTSPSYLVLQSLDHANGYLERLPMLLCNAAPKIEKLKRKISEHGFVLYGNEPLKITLSPKRFGYTGTEIADILRTFNIECEFADNDFIVLMLSPDMTDEEYSKLIAALSSVKARPEIVSSPPKISPHTAAMTPREAVFSPKESLPREESLGQILADPSVGCPPAVPILICGEVIDEEALCAFRYYGIEKVTVVKNR